MKMESLILATTTNSSATSAQGTTRMPINSEVSGHKGLAPPLVRPESVLLNYDRLVAEAQQQRLVSIDQEVLQLRHLQNQHLKRRQAAVLAGLASVQGNSNSSSTTQVTSPPHFSKGIIGMGIYVPKNTAVAQPKHLSKPPSLHVQSLVMAPSLPKKTTKFLQIGRPLSAPPALASKIMTRETSKRPREESLRSPPSSPPTTTMTMLGGGTTKKQKLGDQPQHTIHTMPLPNNMLLESALSVRQVSLPQSPVQDPKRHNSNLANKAASLLSADQLDFVMAANALNSSSSSRPFPKLQPLKTSHLALRPPPSLHL